MKSTEYKKGREAGKACVEAFKSYGGPWFERPTKEVLLDMWGPKERKKWEPLLKSPDFLEGWSDETGDRRGSYYENVVDGQTHAGICLADFMKDLIADPVRVHALVAFAHGLGVTQRQVGGHAVSLGSSWAVGVRVHEVVNAIKNWPPESGCE